MFHILSMKRAIICRKLIGLKAIYRLLDVVNPLWSWRDIINIYKHTYSKKGSMLSNLSDLNVIHIDNAALVLYSSKNTYTDAFISF